MIISKIKRFVSSLTVISFLVTQLGIAPQVHADVALQKEIALPSPAFSLELAPDLGQIQFLHSGAGPTVIHIQTAHGNYEAQKKIEAMLHHFHKTYGFKLLLLEGSAFKLKPELLRFFPEHSDITAKLLDELTKKALVKGPELYLARQKDSEAYGIEDLDSYVRNGEAFRSVLQEEEKTKSFLSRLHLELEKFTSPYLNPKLRDFLKSLDQFETKKTIPLEGWLESLKEKAKEILEIDLTHPRSQIDWPMLLRIFKLGELEKKINQETLADEKKAFLKKIHFIPKETYQEIERLLSSPVSQNELPDPETGLLFERMVSYLPLDFDYDAYPTVKALIAHLILQSELKGERLIGEIEHLQEKITEALAQTEEEKQLMGLFKDYRLLQKLFSLELTPTDYERIQKRREALYPSRLIPRFLAVNKKKRIKNGGINHLEEIDSLFEKALLFYAGTEERDSHMLQKIESILQKTGETKAIVVTGGFHAGPFKDHFTQKGYSYALISPRLTTSDGKEAYLESILKYSTHETASIALSPRQLKAHRFSPAAIRQEVRNTLSQILSANPQKEILSRQYRESPYEKQFQIRAEVRSGSLTDTDLKSLFQEYKLDMTLDVNRTLFNLIQILSYSNPRYIKWILGSRRTAEDKVVLLQSLTGKKDSKQQPLFNGSQIALIIKSPYDELTLLTELEKLLQLQGPNGEMLLTPYTMAWVLLRRSAIPVRLLERGFLSIIFRVPISQTEFEEDERGRTKATTVAGIEREIAPEQALSFKELEGTISDYINALPDLRKEMGRALFESLYELSEDPSEINHVRLMSEIADNYGVSINEVEDLLSGLRDYLLSKGWEPQGRRAEVRSKKSLNFKDAPAGVLVEPVTHPDQYAALVVKAKELSRQSAEEARHLDGPRAQAALMASQEFRGLARILAFKSFVKEPVHWVWAVYDAKTRQLVGLRIVHSHKPPTEYAPVLDSWGATMAVGVSALQSAYQQKGIGKYLLKKSFDELQRRKIRLYVTQINPQNEYSLRALSKASQEMKFSMHGPMPGSARDVFNVYVVDLSKKSSQKDPVKTHLDSVPLFEYLKSPESGRFKVLEARNKWVVADGAETWAVVSHPRGKKTIRIQLGRDKAHAIESAQDFKHFFEHYGFLADIDEEEPEKIGVTFQADLDHEDAKHHPTQYSHFDDGQGTAYLIARLLNEVSKSSGTEFEQITAAVGMAADQSVKEITAGGIKIRVLSSEDQKTVEIRKLPVAPTTYGTILNLFAQRLGYKDASSFREKISKIRRGEENYAWFRDPGTARAFGWFSPAQEGDKIILRPEVRGTQAGELPEGIVIEEVSDSKHFPELARKASELHQQSATAGDVWAPKEFRYASRLLTSEKFIKNPVREIWAVYDEKQGHNLIGLYTVASDPNPPAPLSSLNVEMGLGGIVLTPGEHRRKGIATYLIKMSFDYLRARNIRLFVSIIDPANDYSLKTLYKASQQAGLQLFGPLTLPDKTQNYIVDLSPSREANDPVRKFLQSLPLVQLSRSEVRVNVQDYFKQAERILQGTGEGPEIEGLEKRVQRLLKAIGESASQPSSRVSKMEIAVRVFRKLEEALWLLKFVAEREPRQNWPDQILIPVRVEFSESEEAGQFSLQIGERKLTTAIPKRELKTVTLEPILRRLRLYGVEAYIGLSVAPSLRVTPPEDPQGLPLKEAGKLARRIARQLNQFFKDAGGRPVHFRFVPQVRSSRSEVRSGKKTVEIKIIPENFKRGKGAASATFTSSDYSGVENGVTAVDLFWTPEYIKEHNLKKFSERQTAEAIQTFLTAKDHLNLRLILFRIMGREVGLPEITTPVFVRLMALGSFERIYQAGLKIKGRPEPILFAVHVPRDDYSSKQVLSDALNLSNFGRISARYLPRPYVASKSQSNDGVSFNITTNEWLDEYYEAHIDTKINGTRFILWTRPKDTLITSDKAMKEITTQIYKILTVYNEIKLDSVYLNSGDFVVKRNRDGSYHVELITARFVDKGVKKISYRDQVIVRTSLLKFLGDLFQLRAGTYEDEQALVKQRLGIEKAGINLIRIADFDTVLEGFVEGVVERLLIEGAPLETKEQIRKISIPQILRAFQERMDGFRNEYLVEHKREIAAAIDRWIDKTQQGQREKKGPEQKKKRGKRGRSEVRTKKARSGRQIIENYIQQLRHSKDSIPLLSQAQREQTTAWIKRHPERSKKIFLRLLHEKQNLIQFDPILNLILDLRAAETERLRNAEDPKGERIQYVPTNFQTIRNVFNKLDVGEKDVVYDLGSGYGPVVFFVAIATKAKKVVGIELIPERVKRSLEVKSRLKLPKVQFFQKNVRSLSLDDIQDGTLFFLFLPFSSETSAKVAELLDKLAKQKYFRIASVGSPNDTINRLLLSQEHLRLARHTLVTPREFIVIESTYRKILNRRGGSFVSARKPSGFARSEARSEKPKKIIPIAEITPTGSEYKIYAVADALYNFIDFEPGNISGAIVLPRRDTSFYKWVTEGVAIVVGALSIARKLEKWFPGAAQLFKLFVTGDAIVIRASVLKGSRRKPVDFVRRLLQEERIHLETSRLSKRDWKKVRKIFEHSKDSALPRLKSLMKKEGYAAYFADPEFTATELFARMLMFEAQSHRNFIKAWRYFPKEGDPIEKVIDRIFSEDPALARTIKDLRIKTYPVNYKKEIREMRRRIQQSGISVEKGPDYKTILLDWINNRNLPGGSAGRKIRKVFEAVDGIIKEWGPKKPGISRRSEVRTDGLNENEKRTAQILRNHFDSRELYEAAKLDLHSFLVKRKRYPEYRPLVITPSLFEENLRDFKKPIVVLIMEHYGIEADRFESVLAYAESIQRDARVGLEEFERAKVKEEKGNPMAAMQGYWYAGLAGSREAIQSLSVMEARWESQLKAKGLTGKVVFGLTVNQARTFLEATISDSIKGDRWSIPLWLSDISKTALPAFIVYDKNAIVFGWLESSGRVRIAGFGSKLDETLKEMADGVDFQPASHKQSGDGIRVTFSKDKTTVVEFFVYMDKDHPDPWGKYFPWKEPIKANTRSEARAGIRDYENQVQKIANTIKRNAAREAEIKISSFIRSGGKTLDPAAQKLTVEQWKSLLIHILINEQWSSKMSTLKQESAMKKDQLLRSKRPPEFGDTDQLWRIQERLEKKIRLFLSLMSQHFKQYKDQEVSIGLMLKSGNFEPLFDGPSLNQFLGNLDEMSDRYFDVVVDLLRTRDEFSRLVKKYRGTRSEARMTARKVNVSKDELRALVEKHQARLRDIGKDLGIKHDAVSYWIEKYGLSELTKDIRKQRRLDEDFRIGVRSEAQKELIQFVRQFLAHPAILFNSARKPFESTTSFTLKADKQVALVGSFMEGETTHQIKVDMPKLQKGDPLIFTPVWWEHPYAGRRPQWILRMKTPYEERHLRFSKEAYGHLAPIELTQEKYIHAFAQHGEFGTPGLSPFWGSLLTKEVDKRKQIYFGSWLDKGGAFHQVLMSLPIKPGTVIKIRQEFLEQPLPGLEPPNQWVLVADTPKGNIYFIFTNEYRTHLISLKRTPKEYLTAYAKGGKFKDPDDLPFKEDEYKVITIGGRRGTEEGLVSFGQFTKKGKQYKVGARLNVGGGHEVIVGKYFDSKKGWLITIKPNHDNYKDKPVIYYVFTKEGTLTQLPYYQRIVSDVSPQSFGGFLKQRRWAKQWSQYKLSQRTGYAVSYISSVEKGRDRPSLKFALEMGLALGFDGKKLWHEKVESAGSRSEARAGKEIRNGDAEGKFVPDNTPVIGRPSDNMLSLERPIFFKRILEYLLEKVADFSGWFFSLARTVANPSYRKVLQELQRAYSEIEKANLPAPVISLNSYADLINGLKRVHPNYAKVIEDLKKRVNFIQKLISDLPFAADEKHALESAAAHSENAVKIIQKNFIAPRSEAQVEDQSKIVQKARKEQLVRELVVYGKNPNLTFNESERLLKAPENQEDLWSIYKEWEENPQSPLFELIPPELRFAVIRSIKVRFFFSMPKPDNIYEFVLTPLDRNAGPLRYQNYIVKDDWTTNWIKDTLNDLNPGYRVISLAVKMDGGKVEILDPYERARVIKKGTLLTASFAQRDVSRSETRSNWTSEILKVIELVENSSLGSDAGRVQVLDHLNKARMRAEKVENQEALKELKDARRSFRDIIRNSASSISKARSALERLITKFNKETKSERDLTRIEEEQKESRPEARAAEEDFVDFFVASLRDEKTANYIKLLIQQIEEMRHFETDEKLIRQLYDKAPLQIYPRLRRALNDPRESKRLEAIRALSQLSPDISRNAIKRLSVLSQQDASEAVRQLAFLAAEDIGFRFEMGKWNESYPEPMMDLIKERSAKLYRLAAGAASYYEYWLKPPDDPSERIMEARKSYEQSDREFHLQLKRLEDEKNKAALEELLQFFGDENSKVFVREILYGELGAQKYRAYRQLVRDALFRIQNKSPRPEVRKIIHRQRILIQSYQAPAKTVSVQLVRDPTSQQYQIGVGGLFAGRVFYTPEITSEEKAEDFYQEALNFFRSVSEARLPWEQIQRDAQNHFGQRWSLPLNRFRRSEARLPEFGGQARSSEMWAEIDQIKADAIKILQEAPHFNPVIDELTNNAIETIRNKTIEAVTPLVTEIIEQVTEHATPENPPYLEKLLNVKAQLDRAEYLFQKIQLDALSKLLTGVANAFSQTPFISQLRSKNEQWNEIGRNINAKIDALNQRKQSSKVVGKPQEVLETLLRLGPEKSLEWGENYKQLMGQIKAWNEKLELLNEQWVQLQKGDLDELTEPQQKELTNELDRLLVQKQKIYENFNRAVAIYSKLFDEVERFFPDIDIEGESPRSEARIEVPVFYRGRDLINIPLDDFSGFEDIVRAFTRDKRDLILIRRPPLVLGLSNGYEGIISGQTLRHPELKVLQRAALVQETVQTLAQRYMERLVSVPIHPKDIWVSVFKRRTTKWGREYVIDYGPREGLWETVYKDERAKVDRENPFPNVGLSLEDLSNVQADFVLQNFERNPQHQLVSLLRVSLPDGRNYSIKRDRKAQTITISYQKSQKKPLGRTVIYSQSRPEFGALEAEFLRIAESYHRSEVRMDAEFFHQEMRDHIREFKRGAEQKAAKVWRKKGEPTQIQFGEGKAVPIKTPLDLREFLNRRRLHPDIDEETREVGVAPSFTGFEEKKQKFDTHYMDIADPKQIALALAEVLSDVIRSGVKVQIDKRKVSGQEGPTKSLIVNVDDGSFEVSVRTFPQTLRITAERLPKGPLTYFELLSFLASKLGYRDYNIVAHHSSLEIFRKGELLSWSPEIKRLDPKKFTPASFVQVGDEIHLRRPKKLPPHLFRAEVRAESSVPTPMLKTYPENLAGAKALLKDTLDWLIKTGYPNPEILRVFKNDLNRAVAAPPESATSVPPNIRKIRPVREVAGEIAGYGDLKIELNVSSIFSRMENAKKLDSPDYFYTEIAALAVRETWGSWIMKHWDTDHARFRKTIYQSLRPIEKSPQGVLIPAEQEAQNLIQASDAIKAFTAYVVSTELFESLKAYEALEWGKKKGFLDPSALASKIALLGDSKQNVHKSAQLLATKGDPVRLLQMELGYALRNTLRLHLEDRLKDPENLQSLTYYYFLILQFVNGNLGEIKNNEDINRILNQIGNYPLAEESSPDLLLKSTQGLLALVNQRLAPFLTRAEVRSKSDKGNKAQQTALTVISDFYSDIINSFIEIEAPFSLLVLGKEKTYEELNKIPRIRHFNKIFDKFGPILKKYLQESKYRTGFVQADPNEEIRKGLRTARQMKAVARELKRWIQTRRFMQAALRLISEDKYSGMLEDAQAAEKRISEFIRQLQSRRSEVRAPIDELLFERTLEVAVEVPPSPKRKFHLQAVAHKRKGWGLVRDYHERAGYALKEVKRPDGEAGDLLDIRFRVVETGHIMGHLRANWVGNDLSEIDSELSTFFQGQGVMKTIWKEEIGPKILNVKGMTVFGELANEASIAALATLILEARPNEQHPMLETMRKMRAAYDRLAPDVNHLAHLREGQEDWQRKRTQLDLINKSLGSAVAAYLLEQKLDFTQEQLAQLPIGKLFTYGGVDELVLEAKIDTAVTGQELRVGLLFGGTVTMKREKEGEQKSKNRSEVRSNSSSSIKADRYFRGDPAIVKRVTRLLNEEDSPFLLSIRQELQKLYQKGHISFSDKLQKHSAFILNRMAFEIIFLDRIKELHPVQMKWHEDLEAVGAIWAEDAGLLWKKPFTYEGFLPEHRIPQGNRGYADFDKIITEESHHFAQRYLRDLYSFEKKSYRGVGSGIFLAFDEASARIEERLSQWASGKIPNVFAMPKEEEASSFDALFNFDRGHVLGDQLSQKVFNILKEWMETGSIMKQDIPKYARAYARLFTGINSSALSRPGDRALNQFSRFVDSEYHEIRSFQPNPYTEELLSWRKGLKDIKSRLQNKQKKESLIARGIDVERLLRWWEASSRFNPKSPKAEQEAEALLLEMDQILIDIEILSGGKQERQNTRRELTPYTARLNSLYKSFRKNRIWNLLENGKNREELTARGVDANRILRWKQSSTRFNPESPNTEQRAKVLVEEMHQVLIEAKKLIDQDRRRAKRYADKLTREIFFLSSPEALLQKSSHGLKPKESTRPEVRNVNQAFEAIRREIGRILENPTIKVPEAMGAFHVQQRAWETKYGKAKPWPRKLNELYRFLFDHFVLDKTKTIWMNNRKEGITKAFTELDSLLTTKRYSLPYARDLVDAYLEFTDVRPREKAGIIPEAYEESLWPWVLALSVKGGAKAIRYLGKELKRVGNDKFYPSKDDEKNNHWSVALQEILLEAIFLSRTYSDKDVQAKHKTLFEAQRLQSPHVRHLAKALLKRELNSLERHSIQEHKILDLYIKTRIQVSSEKNSLDYSEAVSVDKTPLLPPIKNPRNGYKNKRRPEVRAKTLKTILREVGKSKDIYRHEIIQAYQKAVGNISLAAELANLDYSTYRGRARLLGVKFSEIEFPSGTLLQMLAKKGGTTLEDIEKIKREVLQWLNQADQTGMTWNLVHLRRKLIEKLPFLSSPNFSYARLLWGLSLSQEFLAEYQKRDHFYGGISTRVGNSFGFAPTQAKTSLESMLAELASLLKINKIPVAAQKDLLDVLGMTREEALQELDQPHINWSLPSFMKAHEKQLSWIMGQGGYAKLLKRLGIEEEYRAKMKERWLDASGIKEAATRWLGLSQEGFNSLAKSLSIDFSTIEIPAGNLLKTLGQDKVGILQYLEKINWDLSKLKDHLFRSHPFIHKEAVSYATLIWGLDLVSEFFSRFYAHKQIHKGDLQQAAKDFGIDKRYLQILLRGILFREAKKRKLTVEERILMLQISKDVVHRKLSKKSSSSRAEVRSVPQSSIESLYQPLDARYFKEIRKSFFKQIKDPAIFVPSAGSDIASILLLTNATAAILIDHLSFGNPLVRVPDETIEKYFKTKKSITYNTNPIFLEGNTRTFVIEELKRIGADFDPERDIVQDLQFPNVYHLHFKWAYPNEEPKDREFIFVGGKDMNQVNRKDFKTWLKWLPKSKRLKFDGMILKAPEFLRKKMKFEDVDTALDPKAKLLRLTRPFLRRNAHIVSDIALYEALSLKMQEVSTNSLRELEEAGAQFGYNRNVPHAHAIKEGALIYKKSRPEVRKDEKNLGVPRLAEINANASFFDPTRGQRQPSPRFQSRQLREKASRYSPSNPPPDAALRLGQILYATKYSNRINTPNPILINRGTAEENQNVRSPAPKVSSASLKIDFEKSNLRMTGKLPKPAFVVNKNINNKNDLKLIQPARITRKAGQLLTREVRTTSEIAAQTIRERFREEGPQIFANMVRILLGPEAFTGDEIQPVLPAFSRQEIESMGILHSIIAMPSQTKRRLFDYRKLPSEPSDLDPLILYALAHPEVKYTLILDSPPETVNDFRKKLEKYTEAEYKQTVPANFQLIHIESEKLVPEIQQLISKEATPAGFVTEDPVLAEMGHRKGLLRVFGFSDPIQQNAAVLVTAEELAKPIPDGMFFLPQRVEQLDPEHRWTELLASLEARQAFLAAA